MDALLNLAVFSITNTRHCDDESVSGLVSVVFLYKFSLKMAAPLLNCRTMSFDLFIVVIRY